MKDVEYSAEELRQDGHRTSACITREYYREMRNKGPFDYQLPEPLIVAPQGGCVDVYLRAKQHDDWWKGGVAFYGVRLVPVPSSTSSQHVPVQEAEEEMENSDDYIQWMEEWTESDYDSVQEAEERTESGYSSDQEMEE
jgi:hypothetical protein